MSDTSEFIVTALVSGAVGYDLRQKEVDRLVYEKAALKRQLASKDVELLIANIQISLKDAHCSRLQQQLAALSQEDKE